MPTPTYDLIASNVLGSSASEVTFSSLPSTGYRDLILAINGGATGFSSLFRLRFNSDTGSNYSIVRAAGDGSTTNSGTNTATSMQIEAGFTNSSDFNSMRLIQIFDYNQTDKHKSVLVRNNSASGETAMIAGRWASTAAITSVTITTTNANTYSAGTTFYLYGIAS